VASGRRFVSIRFDEKDLATLLVESSLAKVNERRVQMAAGGLHEKLLETQEKEQKENKGVWSTDGKLLDKHRRELIFYGESDYNPVSILAQS
jgi:endonuclease YncB( thermonuclease family)